MNITLIYNVLNKKQPKKCTFFEWYLVYFKGFLTSFYQYFNLKMKSNGTH